MVAAQPIEAALVGGIFTTPTAGWIAIGLVLLGLADVITGVMRRRLKARMSSQKTTTALILLVVILALIAAAGFALTLNKKNIGAAFALAAGLLAFAWGIYFERNQSSKEGLSTSDSGEHSADGEADSPTHSP